MWCISVLRCCWLFNKQLTQKSSYRLSMESGQQAPFSPVELAESDGPVALSATKHARRWRLLVVGMPARAGRVRRLYLTLRGRRVHLRSENKWFGMWWKHHRRCMDVQEVRCRRGRLLQLEQTRALNALPQVPLGREACRHDDGFISPANGMLRPVLPPACPQSTAQEEAYVG